MSGEVLAEEPVAEAEMSGSLKISAKSIRS